MNIEKGTQLNIFKNEKTYALADGGAKTIYNFSSYINKKVDGGYEKMPIRVAFSQDCIPTDKQDQMKCNKCYVTEIHEGFFTFDSWKDANQVNHYIPKVVITKGKCLQTKDCKVKETEAEDSFF